jgi:DNA integrity scanning protein DisA with diadenylate cyclase activity/mannitol/fructose-specific phosphotransferase system IIA component (Ntr-type)
MPLHQYLKNSTIIDLKSYDKTEALKELAAHLIKATGTTRRKKIIIDEILKREESASTFIGHGIAIPHTRAAIKEEFAFVVGRSVQGIKYDAARGALAHIIVLLFTNTETDPNKHINLMTEIVSTFKSDVVKEQILKTGPVDIQALLASYSETTQKIEEKGKRTTRKKAEPILSAALTVAREIKATSVFVFADSVRDDEFLKYMRIPSKLIVLTSNKSRFNQKDKRIRATIQLPSFQTPRSAGIIKIGILLALSRGLISKDDKVLCITGNPRTAEFDTIMALNVKSEYEFFFSASHSFLPPDVKPEVLERVLGLASEIAAEGREGKPTGTIFVIGDTNSVNVYVRQLIINPFRGYSEAERNIIDPGLTETIKEFAAIDGAFIITGDGIVLSAGSYLRPQAEIESLPSGFGSRHAAAAGISACTDAMAITISESTGMVTLFKNGSIILTLAKSVHYDKKSIQKILE